MNVDLANATRAEADEVPMTDELLRRLRESGGL